MLSLSRNALIISRRLASAAPKTTTGIEHAETTKKTGEKHQMDQKKYKVEDYHKTNVWSYYKKEEDMESLRCKQPSNKKPDTQPKVTKKPDTESKDAKK
uniref:NADH dehydrogenase [ubiquinone] flavoprotein 3, mitochondrial n=1 Tax=Plectus sambesii TaxID=2011161 RepID=A0A914VX27_9BILA